MKISNQCTGLAVVFVSVSLISCFWATYSRTLTASIVYCTCCATSGALALILLDIVRLSPADSHSWRTLILQYVIIRILTTAGSYFYGRFIRDCSKVAHVQKEILLNILRRNQDTVYGVDFQLGKIISREQFVRDHPLTSYQHYNKYIESILAGKQGALTADPVIYIAMTSGTTGKNKRIPLTRHMKYSYGRKIGSMIYYLMQQQGELNLQRLFNLSFGMDTNKIHSGLSAGPLTAHMNRVMPFAVSPSASLDINQEQVAIYVNAVFALCDRNIGHIEVSMSPLLYTFWQYLHANWLSLCSDIEAGKLSLDVPLDDAKRQTLQKHVSPRPQRAEELRKCFLAGPIGLAKRIWPNLRFVSMLNTGSFAHYARLLEKREMTDVIQMSTLHVASEGFMGINISLNPSCSGCASYAPCYNYGFLEFIPESHIEDDQPETFFCEQLKPGEKYEMVMTTPMGLYRYRTGDIVRVREYIDQCPVYDYVDRIGQLISVAGEKVPVTVLYEVVDMTVKSLHNVWLRDFTATEHWNLPSKSGQSRTDKHHVLFIEVDGNETEACPLLTTSDTVLFDDTMCESFELYQMFRNNGIIGSMRVVQVRLNSFQLLKSEMIRETQTQQFKMPRVLRNKEYLQFLLDRAIPGDE